jgi:uncharacterized protein (DUF2225 family)
MGGPMTNSLKKASLAKSPEDTFNKLRRVDYTTACAEYSMACMHLPLLATAEEMAEVAAPALKRVGWTYEDLVEESRKHE